MSKITGKISAIWKRLSDKEYRDAYVAGKVANDIAFQVFHLREHLGWTQGELAKRADTQQPAISRVERSIGSLNVGTLLKVAAAFDVGLSIRFVPFSQLVSQAADDRLDAPVPSFDKDISPVAQSTSIMLELAKPAFSWVGESDDTDEAIDAEFAWPPPFTETVTTGVKRLELQ